MPRLKHRRNASSTEDFVQQATDVLRGAKHNRNVAWPRVAVDEQTFDASRDPFHFAGLSRRGEDLETGGSWGIGSFPVSWIDKQRLFQMPDGRPDRGLGAGDFFHSQMVGMSPLEFR